MPKYRINLVRTDSFTIEVEAGDEDEALDIAYGEAPRLDAQSSGWGKKWGIDDGEWVSLEDFHGVDYKPKMHGSTVEEIAEG